MSRRTFLKMCGALTAVLALPAAYAPRVAAAVAAAPRLPVVWLRGLGCGGDTEALLRAASPTTSELLLDLLSIDYQDAFMVSSGASAVAMQADVAKRYPGGYLAVVEGAVPTADGGTHLTIGGRPFADVVREASGGAIATIAVGSCASDGGLAGAAGGSTGAVGVGRIVSNSRLVALPGCPVNVENLTATIVHYLTFKELPATDGRGRPLFAYGSLIHNQCGRRSHFEFGEFVQAWGDEGAQKGWCLYKMGCKGPESFANCPSVRYGSGTSWPVKAGAGCIGCAMPGFWDSMSPFSQRLPSPIPFAPDLGADQVGQAVVAGVGGLVAVHGAASVVRGRFGRAHRAPNVDRPPGPAERKPIAAEAAPVEPGAAVTAESSPEAQAQAPAGTAEAGPTGEADATPRAAANPTVGADERATSAEPAPGVHEPESPVVGQEPVASAVAGSTEHDEARHVEAPPDDETAPAGSTAAAVPTAPATPSAAAARTAPDSPIEPTPPPDAPAGERGPI